MKIIKNIALLMMLFIFSAQLSFGQRTIQRTDGMIIKKGDYIQDSRIDKFVGVWEGRNTQELFRIVFKKGLFTIPEFNTKSNGLFGWHYYSPYKYDSTIETSLANFGSTDPIKSTVSGFSVSDTEVTISFYDITKDKVGSATLKLVTGTTDQANWTLTENPGLKGNDFTYGFSVPTTTILNKTSSDPSKWE